MPIIPYYMAVTDLLTKKPFYRLQNSGLTKKSEVPVDSMRYTEKKTVGMPMTQTDFLEEYYPSAHKITSEVFFPECYNYGEVITETGEKMETMYREETFRVAVPLQAVITVQHLVHMFGNDTHHELTDTKVNDELNTKFYDYQNGWLVKNMDIALYQLGRSADITGDGALVFYYYQGQIHTKNLSFLDGDLIFPHYDSITGEMDVFARKFSSYDEQGNEVISWVEVWDNEYLTRYKQTTTGVRGVWNRAIGAFGFDGYQVAERRKHGFSRCPVVYYRSKENGPVWNNVQYLVDDIEVALSYWAKACASTANDAYILKGDDVEIKGDPLGRVRAFTMGKEDDVSLLEKKSDNGYFQAYVDRLYKELFRGSFTVEPPELTAGDKPSSAIKLVYAPSLDKAILDAKDYKETIDNCKSLFCEGYGTELGRRTEFMELDKHIYSWIIPFVHESTESLVANLVQLKNSELISTTTAVEHSPYSTNNEADKIFKEMKQQQAADRLYQLKTAQAE